MKKFNLHLVSDSTGETVSSVSRAACAQFENAEPEEYVWSLIRTRSQMERVIDMIEHHPGVVMFTLIDQDLREMLRKTCSRLGIPCIPVIAPVISEIASYLGEETYQQPGRQHQMDEEYFTRVDAINFALAHDDGQGTWELEEADIVIVGPSRTSKSPTCVYLAYKGFKAANVPYVLDVPLPQSLFEIKKPLIVGLTISQDRLQQIRKTRLQSIKQEEETNYIDSEYIQREIREARKLFNQQRWPVIDVTKRSVEETAANIQQHFYKHREANP